MTMKRATPTSAPPDAAEPALAGRRDSRGEPTLTPRRGPDAAETTDQAADSADRRTRLMRPTGRRREADEADDEPADEPTTRPAAPTRPRGGRLGAATPSAAPPRPSEPEADADEPRGPAR